MKGYEAFKQLRIKSGYTVRNFAQIADISPRTLTYYENGEKSLLLVPVEKAIRLFQPLNVPVSVFFYENYPIKSEIAVKVAEWNELHVRETDKEKIRIRLKNRIYKMKERSEDTTGEIDKIYSIFEERMKALFSALGDKKTLAEGEYEIYVSPVIYAIRKVQMPEASPDPVSFAILDAFYHTEYSFHDLSEICGVSQQHLKGRINKNELGKLHIGTMLKLFTLLDMDFEEYYGAGTNESSS